MITGINIQNVATYTRPAILNDLRKINFIFGANGTGKTTISRVIEQATGHEDCFCQWTGGTPLEVMVYNKDFVDRNFNQENTVKGIFTLGDNQVEAEKEIAKLKPELDKLDKDINKINIQLEGENQSGGKKKEAIELENTLQSQCWEMKKKYDTLFQKAFTGLRNSAEKFKQKVLSEKLSNNADIVDFDILKEKAKTIFSENPDKIDKLPIINAQSLMDMELLDILKKSIVGSQDIDIAAMINRLGNSDWVKQGIYFHQHNDNYCPFCQQSTDKIFAQSLKDFFNDSYEAELRLVTQLANDYKKAIEEVSFTLQTITAIQSAHLDHTLFDVSASALKERMESNLKLIQEKQWEPSRKITLEPLEFFLNPLSEQINAANAAITQHNLTVENLQTEKRQLTNQVWKFILEELSTHLNTYNSNKTQLQNTINGMQSSLEEKKRKRNDIDRQIKEQEKSSTSILPTKDTINALLNSFGFTSFSIDIVDEKGHYKICRSNGDDASRSLSEGEKTFITFLYFYSLIKGAQASSGITQPRIVVFDDPISSLDSDILYIVSSLIKGIFDEIRNNKGYIRQIFILTHNVYFHKEISYHPKRPCDNALAEETFWMVKKQADTSYIEKCSSNPIRSAYELLWEEVKKPNPSSITLQNTLRRILENYFTMWGGMSKNDICELFYGRDKLICQSLFSWVNDGSHSIHDDLYINHGERTNEVYLRVFKDIFTKAKQIGHYELMMGTTEISPNLTTEKA
ncbi:AAA family ATPase [Dickeya chrysanthemi]|uniref:AAA family ATPase n=1 Tax=Dickeya chrysanthemi TaxID=556 RepID=UPI001CF51B7A|nr:AAA family ATPase [Dickeya chrysanthemi]MCA7007826.1 AAA family ATPase [Dickeya chrysanthemi]